MAGMPVTTTDRIETTVVLCADEDCAPAAADVMRRVFLLVLSEDFESDPWSCVFSPKEDEDDDTNGSWQLTTTVDEWDRLKMTIQDEFEADGDWQGVPVDCYRDDDEFRVYFE